MSDFVSMRVIAEAAGVSKAAVSRVINGRPSGIRISAATRDRILAAVRQFGYQPIRFAQDQAPRRQATIALVLTSGGFDASSAHLPAIESVLTANGYRLLLAILPADSGAARERVAALLQDGVAGFLCAPAVMPVVVDRVAGACPVVVMDAVSGQTILRSLGVDIPLPVIPPSVIQPVPVAPPPAIQPVPAISPPIIKPAPSVVAAVLGGTVPEPTLPAIPVPPAPTPVVVPEPVTSQPIMPVVEPTLEPAVIEPPQAAPALESDPSVAEPIPPAPMPESEPVPPPAEPVSVPVPAPAPIESPPVVDPPTIPVPVPEPEPPPVEPVTAPVPIIDPVPESLPSVPDPVVELPVDKPEDPEPEGEVAVPEEDGTAQPDQSIPPPEKNPE